MDSRKNGNAGGAFGLGKAVLWRASQLSMVLLGSRLAAPEPGRSGVRLIGRCELAWHECDGEAFAGPGWFGRPAAGGADSIWGDDALAAALYVDRDAPGTSACVVGFHDAAADADRTAEDLAAAMARAAAREFFPAMVAGRLAVRAEVYHGRRAYDDRRPSWAKDVDPAAHVPQYVRMLTAYRDGATAGRLGDAGAVAGREIALAVPARTAEGPHGEHEHRAVLLVARRRRGRRRRGGAAQRAGHLPRRRDGRRAPLAAGRLPGGAAPSAPCCSAAGRRGCWPPATARRAPPTSPPRRSSRRPSRRPTTAGRPRRRSGPATPAAASPDWTASWRRPSTASAGAEGPAAGRRRRPAALRDLLRLGDGRVPDEGPRVVEQSGSVDADGRWAVSARVRLRPAATPTRLVPAVHFLGEDGDGVAVRWQELTPTTRGCVAEGGGLRLPAGVREVRFAGITDPASHPIPAAAACVAVAIAKFLPIREAQP